MAVGQTVGSLAGLGIANLTPAARAQRRWLREDIEAYEKGDLGLSAAERQQMVGEAQRAASVQQQIQNAQLQAMVAQNPALAGKALASQGQIAETGALAGSQAAQAASALSQQLAEARRQRIRSNVTQQAAQQKAAGAEVGGAVGSAIEEAAPMALGAVLPGYGAAAKGATQMLGGMTPEQAATTYQQLLATDPALARQIAALYGAG
jgi:hypothetical protein